MAAESPSMSSLLGMGVAIAAVLAVGMVLGWLVDSLAGTSPIFVLVGLALGVVGAAGYVISQFRQFLRTDPERQ